MPAVPVTAHAAVDAIPYPAELQRDVDFWIRVYTEITTSEGFLHDDTDLSIVYRKLEFARGIAPRERREAIDVQRGKIEQMLKRLAAGAADLNEEERRIREAFGPNVSAARLREAAGSIRFQLGQADRFREGVERSGTWETHIARTFANLGLPPELAALPHVESSFDPTAYSKVGAAGMWQFMPSTGRLYMRVDEAVDERMDPFRATEAAARLLDNNYKLLGSWPLALTAYNHGAAGMNRARESMGTTDIATIVRNYKSRSFGFASRNFYVSFLAALTIDRDPAKYFPGIRRRQEMAFTEVELPAYIPVAALQKQLGVERGTLEDLNPGLRPAVWEGRLYVPKGYRLRMPVSAGAFNTQQLALRVDAKEQFLGQPRARSYRVHSGETLNAIAAKNGVGLRELASLNGLSTQAKLRAGQSLKLPREALQAPVAAVAALAGTRDGAAIPGAATPAPRPEQVAQQIEQRRAESLAVAQSRARSEEAQPVTAKEARAESPALAPGAPVAVVGDAIDYQIGADNSVRVAAEETIGHFADWLGIPATRLRSLNGLSANAAVPLGRRLKLDFTQVSRETFDARRRGFHDTLQAAFFAAHRVVGTRTYVARSGDSLWTIAQRNGALPIWLLVHYNPQVDFHALRAGQQLVIPSIEGVPAA